MDLQYLHFLQNIREHNPEFIERFFVFITELDVNAFIILIPCILFWCFSKHAGQIVFFTYNVGTCFNTILKNILCIKRPFVRDVTLHPSALTAKPANYSFPSGHSTIATDVFGSAGWVIRNKYRILTWILWIFVALVLFSRNYLGAHTPQDVIVALIFGIITILIAELLFNYLKEHPEKDTLVFICGIIISIILYAYTVFRSYPPVEVTSVKPIQSITDNLRAIGGFLGLVIGWYLERKFVKFKDPEKISINEKWARFIVGFITLSILILIVYPLMKPFKIGEISVLKTTQFFLQNIIAMFFIPLMFDPMSSWFKITHNPKVELKKTLLDHIYDATQKNKKEDKKQIENKKEDRKQIDNKKEFVIEKKRKKAKLKNPRTSK